MFVDCCMLKSREWGPVVAVGLRPRPPSSIDASSCASSSHAVGIVSSCPRSAIFDNRRRDASFPHDATDWRNAAATTRSARRLPSRRLRCRWGCSSSPRSLGRHRRLSRMLPYVFLSRTQTTPQGCQHRTIVHSNRYTINF